MNPLNILFFKLAETSVRISLLIIPLLLLRPWLRRTIGSQWLCLLWLIVLGRLLIPLPVESRWSLTPYLPANAKALAPRTVMRVSVTPESLSPPAPVSGQATVTPNGPGRSTTMGWMGALWSAGVALCLARLGLRFWKARRLATQMESVADARASEIFQAIPAEIRRNVRLRTTKALEAPTLAGVLRPQIWLPHLWSEKLTPGELRHVLLHELGHACRHDLLVQWFFAMAECVHWFNPVVWILARCARLDREMACDSWVLTRGDVNDPAHYGSTLLKAVQMLCNPPRTYPGGVAMASSRRNLTVRIAGIGAFCPSPSWRGVTGAGLLLMGTAAFTTHGVAVGNSISAPTDAVAIPAKASIPSPADSPAPVNAGSQIELLTRFVEFGEESDFANASKPGGILGDILAKPPDESAQASGDVKAIMESAKLEEIMGALGKKEGVVLCAPRVTTRPGQRAAVEIIREFRYATKWELATLKDGSSQYTPTAFDTKNVGVTAEVESTIEADGKTIKLHIFPRVVQWLGFKNIDGKEPPEDASEPDWAPEPESNEQGRSPMDKLLAPKGDYPYDHTKPYKPVFSEHKLDASVRLSPGQTALIGNLVEAPLRQQGQLPKRKVVVIFVTGKILTASEVAAQAEAAAKAAESSANKNAPAKAAAGDIPLGEVVKPGFVRSPFAPKGELIDVRGYPAGTEVKDPYSGKIFRVPVM